MSQKLGKYKLLKRLAAGGMGEIWLARQLGLAGFERLAVVKLILPHLARSRKFVEMFLDEARLAGQLSHPHIVQIFDLGQTSETLYIAMEYVHGENLRVVNRSASKKPSRAMPPALVARVISQACEALHYAHTRKDDSGQPLGIVHRDISPQNLLLSYEGQIKVVDFGIAKAVGRMTETKTGDLKGKTVYMSPEQIRGGAIDRRSDVFSLGIVLWELATGTRLYNQESDFLVMQAICDEPAPRPKEVQRTVPAELEGIILRALEKDPGDRFQTANEMHIALERYLQSSAQIVSSSHLSEYMRDLFPERVERFSMLEKGEKPPDSKVLAGMSALFEEPVSASAEQPAAAKHTLPLPEHEPPADRNATPPSVPPPLPPEKPSGSRSASERRGPPREDDAQLEPPPPHGDPHRPPKGAPPKRAAAAPVPEPREEDARAWLDEKTPPEKAPKRRRAAKAPSPPKADEDDIDLSRVVDPYADEAAADEPPRNVPKKKRPSADQAKTGAPDRKSRQKKKRSKRPRDPAAPSLGPLGRARALVARGWYSLPGRGRLTTGTSRLLRLGMLTALLFATAWLCDWTGRTLMPPLDGGMATHIVSVVSSRVDPPPKMVVHIVSNPPGATVVLDGRVFGRTPFTERLPKKESIEIELRSPNHQAWRRTVPAGEDLVEVEAVLQRR